MDTHSRSAVRLLILGAALLASWGGAAEPKAPRLDLSYLVVPTLAGYTLESWRQFDPTGNMPQLEAIYRPSGRTDAFDKVRVIGRWETGVAAGGYAPKQLVLGKKRKADIDDRAASVHVSIDWAAAEDGEPGWMFQVAMLHPNAMSQADGLKIITKIAQEVAMRAEKVIAAQVPEADRKANAAAVEKFQK